MKNMIMGYGITYKQPSIVRGIRIFRAQRRMYMQYICIARIWIFGLVSVCVCVFWLPALYVSFERNSPSFSAAHIVGIFQLTRTQYRVQSTHTAHTHFFEA